MLPHRWSNEQAVRSGTGRAFTALGEPPLVAEGGGRAGVKSMGGWLGWQVGLLADGRGHDITQETRLFDEGKQVTYSMRKKEGLADYRYFPEPDLAPLVITDEYISSVEVRPCHRRPGQGY